MVFRPLLESLYKQSDPRKGGRPPFDAVLMFKVLVLQDFYKLADDQTEFQIRDRYSFCRFLGLAPEGRVPDAKTIWLFRERVKQAQLIERLFEAVLMQIEAAGLSARKGQIVDAALVPVPRQRNSRDDNARIKRGEDPEDWPENKRRQKDVQARWTKKHGKSHYGYKNHISVDRQHKVIRKYAVSSAEVHDSHVFEVLLDEHNSSADVWADSAYNAGEVAALGVSDVRVLQLLFSPSQFDVPADPSVLTKFAAPMRNILFVGRIAPNKMVEDLIQAYAWYFHHIESSSRLILIGSDRPLAPSLAGVILSSLPMITSDGQVTLAASSRPCW